MDSICFVSNRQTSLEARLFARAFARIPELHKFRLITACTTDLDMFVFNMWKSRDRTVDLVLPVDWNYQPNNAQQQILNYVKESGGRVVRSTDSDNRNDPRLEKIISMARFCFVIEIDSDHWTLDWSLEQYNPQKTIVYQWAINTEQNMGCQHLMKSGRAIPVYPVNWRKTFTAFLTGQDDDIQGRPHQLSLGI